MTILKIVLVTVIITSVAANQDLTPAASKDKRHISQLEPYGSLQFHRPPLPSIDYYGESDKGHGGYIVLSHEKGKGHKSKGGGGYGYSTGYSNGYAVGGGHGGGDHSTESHRNGGGTFGGSYYVAKIKGKGKKGYPSKGKGSSHGGKGKRGYGKGKGGGSYGGKGKGSYGGKGKGRSYGGKGKGGSYGGKGKGGTPYGSVGYNSYGGGSGLPDNNGNGGYLYVSGAISNSHGSSGIGSNSYQNGGIGYDSFGSIQGGGSSSSENSGAGLSAYGGGGSQANFYAGGGTQVSSYGAGEVLDTYGIGGLGGSYAGDGVPDSYGIGGVDDSFAISNADGSYASGPLDDSYGNGGVDDSYGGGGVDDYYGGGVVDDLYGVGGVDDSSGGGGYSYGGGGGFVPGGQEKILPGISVGGGGGSGGVEIPEASPILTRSADPKGNTRGVTGTGEGTLSGGGDRSLGGGGEIVESTGRKRSPSDADEDTKNLSENTANKSNKSGSKTSTNSDAESNAKTTVNYNLSINANGDASAVNDNGNNNNVKVDIKTEGAGKAENAFSVSVHISSGNTGNSPSVRYYVSPTSPPIPAIIQASNIETVDSKPATDEKANNSGGSLPGAKRSIKPVSKANQEIFDSGQKNKQGSAAIPEVTEKQVKDNKPTKIVAPINNPVKLKAPEGNPGKASALKITPSLVSPSSATSPKPNLPRRTKVKVENVPRKVMGRNGTRTSRTTTPSPGKNTTESSATPNTAEEQSSIGCTSGCFSIPPVAGPSIRGQATNSTKSSLSSNSATGRIQRDQEQVTVSGRKENQSPTGKGSTSNFGKSSASVNVPKGKVQVEMTSGIAIKGSNASGNTGKDKMRLIGSTTSFFNIPGSGSDAVGNVQHVKHGGEKRNVGMANNTNIPKPNAVPATENIHSLIGFDANENKDLKRPRPARQNETKLTHSSTSATRRPVRRHNPRLRPTKVSENTTSFAGNKAENNKGSAIAKNVPIDGGKHNAMFRINARLNTTRPPVTQRPRSVRKDTLSLSGEPITIDIPLGVAGRGQRGLDTIGNGTKSSSKTKSKPNTRPVQLSRHHKTHNPIPANVEELLFPRNVPANAGRDQRGQVSTTPAAVRDERTGTKGNSNASVGATRLLPYIPIDRYYLPLRRFIRQKQMQWS